MPNHVTTICTVIGADLHVEAFRAAHIRPRDNGKVRFDFNTVIPMPESVRATDSGSQADLGFYALTGLCDFIPPHRPAGYDGPMRHEALLEWMEEHQPDVVAKGRAQLLAFRETGHRDWYSWAPEMWGTKWNSYDYEDRDSKPGAFAFKFETAWSFPEPIFRKLAALYPELVFRILSYDEGDNFACVGEFNGANDYRTVDATDELYEQVYGEPRERDEAEA